MGTLAWLIFMTVAGALVGHFAFGAIGWGAVAGFVIGLAIRLGGGDDIIDVD